MTRFDIPRVRSWMAFGALLLLLGSLAFVAIAARPTSAPLGAQPKQPVVRTDALTDTAIVHGPTYFLNESDPPIWTLYSDQFQVSNTLGRRYLLDIGDNGASKIRVSVNQQEWVGENEQTLGNTQRIIDVTSGTIPLTIGLYGSEGTGLTARVVHVSDPSYQVYPWTQFTRLVPADTQWVSFSVDTDNAADVGMLRMINGSGYGSNRVTSGKVWLNGTQVLSNAEFGTGKATATKNVTLLVNNTVKILNQSAVNTYLKLQFRAIDDTPPAVTLSLPAPDTLFTNSASVSLIGQVVDQTPCSLSVNSGPRILASPGFSTPFALPGIGRYSAQMAIRNSAGLTTTVTQQIVRDTLAPTLTVTTPSEGIPSTADSLITVAGTWRDSTFTTVTVDGEAVATGYGGSFSLSNYRLDLGTNRIVCRAVDAANNKRELTRLVFRSLAGEPTPPDSTLDETGFSVTATTAFYEGVRFLFSGASAVQLGVDSTKFIPAFAAVVRGQVRARDFGPVGNVTVRVLNHPEYGHAITR